VARGDHDRDPGASHVRDRVVGSLRRATAQAHVGHGRELRVLGDPVHAGNHARVGARTIAAEYAHGVNGCAFGHAVGGPGHRAGHVRAVAVAVGPAAAVVDGGVAIAHAAAELVV